MSKKIISTFLAITTVASISAFTISNAFAFNIQEIREQQRNNRPLSSPFLLCDHNRMKKELAEIKAFKTLSTQLSSGEIKEIMRQIKEGMEERCREAITGEREEAPSTTRFQKVRWY